MTDNEQKQIHLSRKQNLIELDFPIISGGIRLTDWINNKGVHTKFNFILDHKLFLLYIDLEYCCT
jgi:hypothetical protein